MAWRGICVKPLPVQCVWRIYILSVLNGVKTDVTNMELHRYSVKPATVLIWYHTRWALWGLMMTSSNGNIFRVTGPLCGEFTDRGEFPIQRPVTWSFSLICVWINGWSWWFETPSWSLWCQCNDKLVAIHLVIQFTAIMGALLGLSKKVDILQMNYSYQFSWNHPILLQIQ